MLNPCLHAESVTGQKQSAVINLWDTLGFAAAVSDVTGPRLYEYGVMNVPTVAITLYNVKRHVLIEDGRVRRDACVRSGRFRIGQPGRHVTVDATPDAISGKLVLLYLGERLLNNVIAESSSAPIEFADRAWEIEDPFLKQVAMRLAQNADAGQPGQRLFLEQLAFSLAYHVAQRYASSGPASRLARDNRHLSTRTLADVIDYVRSNPAADIAIGDLSELVGLSGSHLIRAFRTTTGLTPHRFIIRERVAMAQDLLANSSMPIAELAIACGFSSQSHLGAAFRSVVGVTPAEYRRVRRM